MMTRTPSAVPQTTAVYDTLWRMAAERQRIYRRRLRNEAQPWTGDPVLRSYRFTNAYRAADRVSQYAIKLGNPTTETPEPADVFLRMMLLKTLQPPRYLRDPDQRPRNPVRRLVRFRGGGTGP